MLGSTYFYALLVRPLQDLQSCCSCSSEGRTSRAGRCALLLRKDSLAFVEALKTVRNLCTGASDAMRVTPVPSDPLAGVAVLEWRSMR